MPKIMVVDDDKEFTTLYREYLWLVGYETVTENESSKAMDLAIATHPDLILLDLMMPPPDGFKLCRMFRDSPLFMYVPIIIITALNDTDSRMVAFGAGADDYLVKPFHFDTLKARIDFLLERMK